MAKQVVYMIVSVTCWSPSCNLRDGIGHNGVIFCLRILRCQMTREQSIKLWTLMKWTLICDRNKCVYIYIYNLFEYFETCKIYVIQFRNGEYFVAVSPVPPFSCCLPLITCDWWVKCRRSSHLSVQWRLQCASLFSVVEREWIYVSLSLKDVCF